MADSSNTEVDSQVDESTESETTSNSDGNFSGGLDSSALSDETFSTDSTPDFGIDFGSNNNNGSFDFDYNPFDDLDFDFGDGPSGDSDSSSDSSKTSETYNESEPVMTVDEVYGKGNQSIVEDQGDYAASSNEKSNVETSTLGKQDEISVTPTSVTEDKGLVSNNAIQSVEGLNFQQKDKESQDVLEAKKNRDEAEAKDKTAQMKDSLLANIGKPIGKQGEGDVSKFQLGKEIDFDKQDKAKLNELNKQKQQVEDLSNKEKEAITAKDKAEADEKAAITAADKAEADAKQAKQELSKVQSYVDNITVNKDDSPLGKFASAAKSAWDIMTNRSIQKAQAELDSLAKKYGIDVGDTSKFITGNSLAEGIETIDNTMQARVQEAQAAKQEAITNAESARNLVTEISTERQAAQDTYTKSEKEYDTWRAGYWAGVEKSKAEEEAAAKAKAAEKPVTPDPKAPVTTTPTLSKADQSTQTALDAIANSTTLSPEQKAQATQSLNDLKTSRQAVEKAALKLTSDPENVKPEDIKTFFESTKQYQEEIKDALKGNPLTKTDYNRTFTGAIADAIDFKVTLADGTVKSYSDFMMDMVTKSPAIAQAMYEERADRLERENHPILAKIARAEAAMSKTWIGSKLTWADNQVRNQFNQMAKTNMRAVYATYNNVKNDKTGKYSEDDKAKASEEIGQANALMTASAALKASTGFWSGIGDSVKDGVYGKTDPEKLNTYQKTLNTVDNLCKLTLGLGVTPGANKARQNMYYMAGDKVNESGLFNRDWDGDGFALCQEYGNSATAAMIAGAGELATGVVLFFNPSTIGMGLNLVVDAIQTAINGLYGVQKDARKSQQYTQEVLSYFEEAKDIAEQSGNEEAVDSISDGITQIENFELKPDEVGNLNNWLEGSGSNTADNGKFNQALTYDEWLKLIEADPTMRDYAKKLIAEKKSE